MANEKMKICIYLDMVNRRVKGLNFGIWGTSRTYTRHLCHCNIQAHLGLLGAIV